MRDDKVNALFPQIFSYQRVAALHDPAPPHARASPHTWAAPIYARLQWHSRYSAITPRLSRIE
ncbi:hypothetical protein XAPC_1915 [Xanthomonas citri pv. punicae str. LMG 859]|nr:hypothetical protein XAPC_1915 [Xanthomonas citri pv. punicae str. LMG 859]